MYKTLNIQDTVDNVGIVLRLDLINCLDIIRLTSILYQDFDNFVLNHFLRFNLKSAFPNKVLNYDITVACFGRG